MMKTCSKCKAPRPVSCFYRDKSRGDGLDTKCKACRKAHNQTWTDANGHMGRRYGYRYRWGLSLEQRAALVAEQGGRCAICGQDEATAPLYGRQVTPQLDTDHCHTTLELRGFLCNPCNSGLEKFKDDPARLRRAAEYLEAPPLAGRGLVAPR